MVSRSEIDMLDIREVFRTKYEKSLYNMIKVSAGGSCSPSKQLLVLPPSWCQRPWEGCAGGPCLRTEFRETPLHEPIPWHYLDSPYGMVLCLCLLFQEDTSGEYKKALLKLCGGDDE